MRTTKFHRIDKFPYVSLENSSDYNRTTSEFDKTASRYLYMALCPLFVGYIIYSLFYESHKSWYSFILSSLVGFIYIFGFINMCP